MVCEVGAPRRLTLLKRVVLQAVGVRQMVHARNEGRVERVAVRPQPSNTDAPKPHPVVAPLAANEPGSSAFAVGCER